MRKNVYAVVALVGMAGSAFGQSTLGQVSADRFFQEGLSLFAQAKYAAARPAFEESLRQHPSPEKDVQALYHLGRCLMELGQPFHGPLDELVNRHPAHPLAPLAYRDMGNHYFLKKDYGRSLDYYSKNTNPDFTDAQNVEAYFRMGYAYFQTSQADKAEKVFAQLAKGSHAYTYKASYYAGYLAYQRGDLDGATTLLAKAEQDAGLRAPAAALTLAILYQQGKHDQLLATYERMKQEGISLPPDANLLVGEAYYHKGRYAESIPALEDYVKRASARDKREVHYRLGFAYLQLGQSEASIGHLNKAADGEDALAQASAYYLGSNYVKLGKKELAIAAFDKCRKLTYDARMQEYAAYYYTQTTFDAGDFRACIKGCEEYFQQFVQGDHTEEVYHLSTEAYLYTGDYDKALAHFSRIANKTPRIKQAYQQIAYNKAVEEMNDGHVDQAAELLRTSLENPYDASLRDQAYFWLAEAYAQQGQADKAYEHYQRVPSSAPQYAMAQYGMGYARFKQGDYAQAASFFKVAAEKDERPEYAANALTRLADCHYMQRSYAEALRTYERALSQRGAERDYIAYQMASTHKAAGQPAEAVKQYELLLREHRNSPLRDKAYFYLGRLFFENARYGDAIAQYNKLEQEHPSSPLLSGVYAQRALANRLHGKPKEAIADYKRVIDLSPTSVEAENAIQSLQELAAAGVSVPQLETYKQRFKQANPNSLATVQADFEQANQLFAQGEYAKAIPALEEFVSKTPQSRYHDEAYLALGFSHRAVGKPEYALAAYQQVKAPAEKAKALRNIADIQYGLGKHEPAYSAYAELRASASDAVSQQAAVQGLMRTAYELQRWEEVNTLAAEILSGKMRRYELEAELYKGRVLLQQQKYISAVEQFKKVTARSESMLGAEAQYRIGETLHLNGEYEQSTKALLEVRNKYGTYQKWLYEAFLLIAKNYQKLDNDFQAKATLRSVIDNSQDETYKRRAQQMLEQMDKPL